MEKGRLLIIRAAMKECHYVFVYIYAPNRGRDWINLLNKLKDALKNIDSEDVLVVGGDWNCTLLFWIEMWKSLLHLLQHLWLGLLLSLVFGMEGEEPMCTSGQNIYKESSD